MTKVLIGKLGLDGHDVGAKLVCRVLMEAGFEVIYTGLRQTPQGIAETARRENVDAIGISILSGSHLPLLARLADELRTAGQATKPWLVGGVIPEQDRPQIRQLGFQGIFPTGSSFDDIASFLEEQAT